MVTDVSKADQAQGLRDAMAAVRNYNTFKAEFDEEIHKAADSYVRIGFLLIEARDTGILEGSGYATMSDFAKTEYGLSPDQTSRFISICERFGDSEGHLKDGYEGFGQTKLIEMLSLPDSITESISPELTREEIRDIKNEVKEENKITPIEAALEPSAVPESFNDLEKFLWTYFEENPDIFIELAVQIDNMSPGPDKEKEILIDNLTNDGIKVLQARVPRIGRLMLSFTGAGNNPALVYVREDKRQEIGWHELYEAIEMRVSNEESLEDDPRMRWEKAYGKEFPKIAPAQVKESTQSQSQTNFEQKSRSAQQVKKSESTKERKVSQGLEEKDTSKEESKAPTNFEGNSKEEEVPESKSETNFEGMNPPTEEEEKSEDTPVGELTHYDRAQRAAKALDEQINLFILNTEPGLIASEIQDQMDRVEEKIATWRNIMIEWRKSKE